MGKHSTPPVFRGLLDVDEIYDSVKADLGFSPDGGQMLRRMATLMLENIGYREEDEEASVRIMQRRDRLMNTPLRTLSGGDHMLHYGARGPQ